MSYFCEPALHNSMLFIPSRQNNMDNKLDFHLPTVKSLVDTNKQVNDELQQYNDELNIILNKYESDLDEIKTLLKQVIFNNQNSLPENMYSIKAQYNTTVVPDNKKAQPLEGGNSTKIVACGISTRQN